jgi:hypothetical protein
MTFALFMSTSCAPAVVVASARMAPVMVAFIGNPLPWNVTFIARVDQRCAVGHRHADAAASLLTRASAIMRCEQWNHGMVDNRSLDTACLAQIVLVASVRVDP